MILKNKKVAIIGAGPVGLTMAKLLQQKGIDVRVYERDKDSMARIWGGTLDLHEASGQIVIKKAGVLEHYFAMARPMGRTLADEQGNVFFSKKPISENPEINRNDLRKLLLDSISNDTVVWDMKFTALEEQDGKWVLHFENGISKTADCVIGANGGMSSVRKYLANADVEYTGTFIIQGEVLNPEIKCADFFQLCDNNILMTAAEGNTLVANPNNNGALTYGVTFRASKEWIRENKLNFQDPDSIITFLSKRFSHWHESYRQLFRATAYFVGLPARKMPLDIPWKNDRHLPITLIGDAAHVMPPFAGQGVNTGLMDALNLCENLTSGKFKTIAAAIADYEQHMFVYAKEVQLETSRNEIEMHHPEFSFKKRFSS